MSDNSRDETLRELCGLVNQLCDGQLSEDQCARLEELVCSSPECSDYYVSVMQVHAGLSRTPLPPLGLGITDSQARAKTSLYGEVLAARNAASGKGDRPATGSTLPASSQLSSVGSPPLSTPPQLGWGATRASLAWPSLALLVLFAAAIGVISSEGWRASRGVPDETAFTSHSRNDGAFEGSADSKSTLPRVTPVAYLTSSTSCAWGSDSPHMRDVGSGVSAGEEIALLEGIAEFRLSGGVYLNLEGPASVVLTSPNSIVLQYGKVTCLTPWSNESFRILAGTCRIEAYEAEYGVNVTGGRVDIHTFSGEVRVRNALLNNDEQSSRNARARGLDVAAREKESFTTAVVRQGRSLRLEDANGLLMPTRREKAKRWLFASKLTMSGELPISDEYVDAVFDSRPTAYWRFESSENSVVPNEVLQGCNLEIVGDLRLSGSSGRRVADFYPGSDSYLISDGPLDFLADTDYSMEVWVKPSHVHAGVLLGLTVSERPPSRMESYRNAYHLELQSSRRQAVQGSFSREHPFTVRYLHRDPPDSNHRMGTSCFSEQHYRIRRWQHMVTVKRGALMEIYLDGKLSATAHDPSSLASDLNLTVGRCEPSSRVYPFQFIGQLDEVAVYKHALSAEEVDKHFRAVDWTDLREGGGSDDDL